MTTFIRSTRGRVLLTEAALAVFNTYRQTGADDLEAGGLLIGRTITDSDDIIVDVATEPSPDDIRTRFSFMRQQEPAQMLVDQHWENSNGTLNYLGEWHSHPEDIPSPSDVDLADWCRVVGSAQHADSLLFLIVGRTHICLWEMGKCGPMAQLEMVP